MNQIVCENKLNFVSVVDTTDIKLIDNISQKELLEETNKTNIKKVINNNSNEVNKSFDETFTKNSFAVQESSLKSNEIISLSTKKTTDEKHISDSNISNDFLNSDNCNNQYNNGTQLLQNMAMKNIFLPTNTNNIHQNLTNNNTWQLFSVTLQRSNFGGFGIAISGGRDNPHIVSKDPSIFVSDVLPAGPAFGLLQVNDQIISINGLSLECADYATAIKIMKEAEQLNMIIKRRVPIPFVEFEQRTLKFTLSKSHKKDDFGIVLGCRYYIKEITNHKLAEKDPGLKEGDTVIRINGQSLDQLTIEEATRLLHRSKEKLSLVVQRDVRRCSDKLRWPSQNTVYERLGSISATPRQSPTPVHFTYSTNSNNLKKLETGFSNASNDFDLLKTSDFSPGLKRFSDSVLNTTSCSSSVLSQNKSVHPQQNQTFSLINNVSTQVHPSTNVYSQQNLDHQKSQNFFFPHLSDNHKMNLNIPNQKYQSTQNHLPQTFYTQKQQNSSQYSQYLDALPKIQTSNINSLSLIDSRHSSCKRLENTKLSSIESQQQNQFNQNSFSQINNVNNYNLNSKQLFQSNNSLSQQIDMLGTINNVFRGSNMRIVKFCKGSGSLGIRVIGGNQVGIFVSAVQEDSPAAKNGIKVGDRIHRVNGYNMDGITREQAVEYLMSLENEVQLQVENSSNQDFLHVKEGKTGDSFYIRTYFSFQKRSSKQELNFHKGDIFHVTDTLAGGSVGFWQVTKVYSANEAEIKSNEASGIIPNNKTAECLAKQLKNDSSTISRSIFRKKLQSHLNLNIVNNENYITSNCASGSTSHNFLFNFDFPLPAYERVVLKKPTFFRPVVLFGPLSDIARNLLLSKYNTRFGAISCEASNVVDDSVMRLSSIDAVMTAQKHCVLSISPESVERLQLAHYAPIVILIDVDSRSRIRELRSKAGSATLSARKLLEQNLKIKKHYSYLLTATLDASKEDGWFEALSHLIFHLQGRRVWMPEFLSDIPAEALLLFPIQNCNLDTPEGDSLSTNSLKLLNNSADYGIYNAYNAETPAYKITSDRYFECLNKQIDFKKQKNYFT